MQIFSKIYIGSNKQAFDLIFDTGSNWLWVNSRMCNNCNKEQPKFDERLSTTFSTYDLVTDLHYGTGDVYGFNSIDQVCIKPDKCSNDFSFLTVFEQDGLDSLYASGIVGLSPGHGSVNDLFIQKLKSSGTIKQAVFSLMIELQHDRSKMTFGGYDLLNMAALGSKLVYLNIDQKVMKWWTLKLNHMTVRDPTGKIDFSKYEYGKDKKLIVDSGTSFLLMPRSDRQAFVKMIEDTTGSYCIDNSLPICSCKNLSNFPDLIFNVDGTEYLVPKEGYIV